MSKNRSDEKTELQSSLRFAKNTTGILKSQLEEAKSRASQTSSPKATLNTASSLKVPPKHFSNLPTRQSLPTIDSPEPYISVGCLKCGAPDHVATNRNCPRPRKAGPIVYGTPVSTPIPKKVISRSPKKHEISNHQLKAARIGDSTKFWYYISDDSEDGKQDSSKLVKKIRFEKDGKYQRQSSATIDKDFYPIGDDESGLLHHSADETIHLGPNPKFIAYKGIMSIKRHKTTGIRDDNDEFTQNLAEITTPSNHSGSNEKIEVRAISQIGPDLKMIHNESVFGSIPSLPWKVPGPLPFLPKKQSVHHLNSSSKTSKTLKQQKRVLKQTGVGDDKEETQDPISAQQKKFYRAEQALYPTTPKDNRPEEDHHAQTIRCSTINTTRELDHSSQFSHLNGRVPSSRYSITNSYHITEGDTNRASSQMIKDSFSEKEIETKVFKYNYMGSRNYIQGPRVRYAPDRVQGWRECRSMGTGLE